MREHDHRRPFAAQPPAGRHRGGFGGGRRRAGRLNGRSDPSLARRPKRKRAPHVFRHMSRQREPAIATVAPDGIVEEVFVQPHVELARARAPIEVRVVGMYVHQRHAPALHDPIELPSPGVDRRFVQQHEQRRILRQGIRQLHVPRPVVASHPERKDRVRAVRLRLEGVDVEGGGVVEDVEVANPAELVEHERRAETHRSPCLEIPVDGAGVRGKALARHVQRAVMMEVVHADFEAVAGQQVTDPRRQDVRAFRHEVERRLNPVSPVGFGEVKAPVQAARAIDVVGDDEGELLAVRPARPSVRDSAGGFVDVPAVGQSPAHSARQTAPKRQTGLPWDRRLERIVRARQQAAHHRSVLPARASRSAFVLFDDWIAVRISDGATRLRISMFGITQWPPMTPGKYLTGGR